MLRNLAEFRTANMPPPDQKRINGPENSYSYHIHSASFQNRFKGKLENLGVRRNVIRKTFMKCGAVSQARGSGYVEMGNTKVLVAVYDPREIPKQNKYQEQGDLYCDFKFAPFACLKRRPPQPDAEEKALARALKRALLPVICRYAFPNFQVDVFAHVLENDGACLAAAINAAGLALADAGIPTYDIVTASCLGVQGDRLLVDPTAQEEDACLSPGIQGNHGIITVARLPTLKQVSEVYQRGCFAPELIPTVFESLDKANDELAAMARHILTKRVTKQARKIELEGNKKLEVIVDGLEI